MTKYYNVRKKISEERPDVDAFLEELDALCKKHNFTIYPDEGYSYWLGRYEKESRGLDRIDVELSLEDEPELPEPPPEPSRYVRPPVYVRPSGVAAEMTRIVKEHKK